MYTCRLVPYGADDALVGSFIRAFTAVRLGPWMAENLG